MLDGAITGFEVRSEGLVLLEDVDVPTVTGEVHRFSSAVRAHVRRAQEEPWRGVEALEKEHRRFEESLEVLAWLLEIVERDDHGGNRQALGQYGKILVEALRAHRRSELERPPSSAGKP